MMMSYRNTLCVAFLLSCLFITLACASSLTRHLTEEEKARPVPSLDKAHYLRKHDDHQRLMISTGISLPDDKVSLSSTVKGLRDLPPSTYSVKMNSFDTLLKSPYVETYESRPFSVGGYNWTLIMYPKGNKNNNGTGYISLYVAIDNSSFVAATQDVYADLRFYVYNKIKKKYFTVQDTNVWRFNALKTMWGFSQVLPLNFLTDPKLGYLSNGYFEFGVDVIIPSLIEKFESFSINSLTNTQLSVGMNILGGLVNDIGTSDEFKIGGKSWNLGLYPNGTGAGEGNAVSLFLFLGQQTKLKLKPYEQIYVRAKLRVLNQRQSSNHVEMQLDNWFDLKTPGWGFHILPLSDLRNLTKGFVVNNLFKVQVVMEAVSSTNYSPS